MGNRAGPAVGIVDIAALGERVRPPALAGHQVLPVQEAMAGLFPWGGLQRGTTVAVVGCAPTSLALALISATSAQGSWTAAVEMPSLGLAAAAELGVVLDRTVLVGPVPPALWANVIATVVEAFDVVLVGPPARAGGPRPAEARRLQARVRERGSVLVQVGWPSSCWPDRPDLTVSAGPLDPAEPWEGIGPGHGHLRARRVSVRVQGRRGADRPRVGEVWLPGPDGRMAELSPDQAPLAVSSGQTPLALVQAS